MDTWLWIGLIGVAAILVFGFRALARRKVSSGRVPVELREIHQSISDKVSFETMEQVYRAIGDAYSLDPRLVRPDDPLKRLLDMDSWALDAGTEKLNVWLRATGVEAERRQIPTILDLLVLVEQSKARTSRSA